jgi:ArsR family transcriptional regulator, lead/cadmium/zinc/bismuth-responsive transcriptional repressor
VRLNLVPHDRCEPLCRDLEKGEALRAIVLAEQAAAHLAERAKALADPTRLRLMAILAESDELCVCDFAWTAGCAENLISHHLRGGDRPGWSQPARREDLALPADRNRAQAPHAVLKVEEATVRAP